MPRLDQQVQEAYLLWSSMRSEEFAWRPNAARDEAKWQAALKKAEQGSDDLETLQGLAPLAFALQLAEPLWLHVDYATESQGTASLTLHGPTIPAEILRDLQQRLATSAREAEEQEQEYIVFAAFTELQAHVSDRKLVAADVAAHCSNGNVAHKQSDAQPSIASIDSVEMLRVIFWTHHLKAPSKKRDMTHWCAELEVFGLVKSGYPGFLCFEGASEGVREMARRIKALQWRAITVKTEVPYTYSLAEPQIVGKGTEEALSHCLLAKEHSAMLAHQSALAKSKDDHEIKLRTTMDEVQTSRELVERLRAAGIPEDEMKYALNLRN